MSRSGESITRVDVRFPNSIYDAVQQLAVKDGARTHHISQKVEVSPTIVKLVLLGLDALVGKLPDNIGGLSGSLPDKLTSAGSGLSSNVSDISDKRIESIVDKRLAELGLFPTSQSPQVSIDDSYLSDSSDTVPDTLSDNNVMISDKSALLPDSLPDTENIPSDDSSNVESIAEDVQVIQTDTIGQVSGEIPTTFSFKGFHDWLEIPPPGKRNKANGDVAVSIAKNKGYGDWVMNSSSYQFTKLTGNNQNG